MSIVDWWLNKKLCLVQMCGSSSWFIPFGLSLPFAWRLLQCLRVYMDTGNRAQLLNALKYASL